jgi:hypothetical protein
MHFSLQDNILWAATFIGHAILFVVLLLRGRWRQFPVFTALICLNVLRTIVLFYLYRRGAYALYRWIYWFAAAADIALQIALVFEIARIVLRPTGTWVRDARASFLTWGSIGAIVALGLSYAVHPSTDTSLNDWMVRGSLFTSLLFCELFLAMMLASHRLGLVWRNHVSSLGQGLTAWALISTIVDTAHSYFPVNSYFGPSHHFSMLEHIRIYAYLGALGYWVVTLWLPEPERRPISPEMQKYLVALHAKVQYDATQVSSVQNLR